MNGEIRVLILDDTRTDAALIQHALARAGGVYRVQRVDSRQGLLQALEEFKPDIVLADFTLPGLNGKEALEIVIRAHPEVPVIIVSGALGDEAAVELVQLGAKDYVLKSNLARLGHVVRRALAMEQGIRARKAAEQALQASEERMRQILEHSSNLFYAHTPDHVLTYMSPQTRQFFDCEPGEALVHWTEFATDNPVNARGYQMTQRAIDTGERQPPFELELVGRRGRKLWVQVNEAPVVRDGRTVAIVGALADITASKHAVASLQASHDLLQTVVENTPVRVFWKDRQLRYLGCNSSFARDAGFTRPEELVGKDDFQMGWHERAELYRADDRQVMDSGMPKLGFEEPLTLPDGRQVWLRTSKVPLRDAGGRVFGVLGIFEDITERKQADELLRRTNRALKTLSAGNEVLIRATDEKELMQEMCRIMVQVGGYRIAAVYAPRQDERKSIAVVAAAGVDPEFLGTLDFTWADTDKGQGTLGRAIRTGQLQISQDIHADPLLAPWRELSDRLGCASTISLPLKDANGQVAYVLSICGAEPGAFIGEETGLLQELANDISYGIVTVRTRGERDRLLMEQMKSSERLKATLSDTIRAIALTVEKRDPYTSGHQQRVAELCLAIGRELGFDADRLEGLRLGSTIHDIGKVYIPAEILSRPGKLKPAEFELVKSHPEIGYEIIKDVRFPWPVGQMILQHHERLDGSGYPSGLRGDAICLEARILAVADVIEAMSSHRPYRPSLGIGPALAEIEHNRGKLYDPAVVDASLKLFRQPGFVLPS